MKHVPQYSNFLTRAYVCEYCLCDDNRHISASMCYSTIGYVLFPVHNQAVGSTSVDFGSIGYTPIYFNAININVWKFQIMHLGVSSGKYRHIFSGVNVFILLVTSTRGTSVRNEPYSPCIYIGLQILAKMFHRVDSNMLFNCYAMCHNIAR